MLMTPTNTFVKINFGRNPQMSFPQRRESTRVGRKWLSAFAGMTNQIHVIGEGIVLFAGNL